MGKVLRFMKRGILYVDQKEGKIIARLSTKEGKSREEVIKKLISLIREMD